MAGCRSQPLDVDFNHPLDTRSACMAMYEYAHCLPCWSASQQEKRKRRDDPIHQDTQPTLQGFLKTCACPLRRNAPPLPAGTGAWLTSCICTSGNQSLLLAVTGSREAWPAGKQFRAGLDGEGFPGSHASLHAGTLLRLSAAARKAGVNRDRKTGVPFKGRGCPTVPSSHRKMGLKGGRGRWKQPKEGRGRGNELIDGGKRDRPT